MAMVNPLDVMCPACLVAPGQDCYATSTDEPRAQPHRLRGLAAARRLVQCQHCSGIGWRPEELETKDA
ncbi:hypothetical protein AB0395_35025 [Streptosporangium sp. NPDC051023]|uniref:hypothetical protein n=1 Tax=Streptosporangium sp. NPDC051023 TaxID=3155410 RepID=UPI00344F1387